MEAPSGSLRRPGETFVGRKPLLRVLRRSFERGRVSIADTWGIPGSGKSALLAQMRTALAAPNDLWIYYRFSTEGLATDESEQTVADYAAFQAFTARIAEDVTTLLAPEAESREARLLQNFQLAYDEARLSVGAINIKVTSIFSSFKDSNIANVDTGTLSESALAKRPRLSAALSTLLRGLTQETPSTGPRRLLIGLDEFEWVPAGLLRRWVLELVRDLDNALVLIPRFPHASAPDGPIDCPLVRLSREEINELAIDCLPHLELAERLLDALEEATDGLPQAVCLAIEVLQRYDVAEEAAAAAELGTLPRDLAQRRARMVETIMGRDGAEAEQVLRACAVMRRFDAAMLAAVVGPQAELQTLKQYSFVEPAPDARDGFFRLHPAVRRELSHRLEQIDPARFLELHRRAADHCAGWIAEFEEEEDVESGSQSYDSWYRYEDARWQAAKREWLFHQARASASGPMERELGRLRLTRVFLDSFWWWGCYLEFPFCRTLVFDWRTTQADRDWADALVQILDAYPHGHEKEKAPHKWRDNELPRWDAVRAALLELRDACGVGGEPGRAGRARAPPRPRLDRDVPRARSRATPRRTRPRSRTRSVTTTPRSSCSRRTTTSGTKRGRGSSVPNSASGIARQMLRAPTGNVRRISSRSSKTRSLPRTFTGSRPMCTRGPATPTLRSRRTDARFIMHTASSGVRTRPTSTRCRFTPSRSRARSAGSWPLLEPAGTLRALSRRSRRRSRVGPHSAPTRSPRSLPPRTSKASARGSFRTRRPPTS